MPATSKPFIFILASFIIVLLLSFLGNTLTVFGIQVKNINIISEILPKQADSAVRELPLVKVTQGRVIPDYRQSEEIIGYDSSGTLSAFVKALHELSSGKRKKVRIAYFGDSMIEGDLISQDLRKLFQDYFGGSGVGFVPITSVVAGFRQTIIHSFSENWSDQHFLNTATSKSDELFISGHVFRPGSASSVYYSAVNQKHLGSFNECYLLYGKRDSLSSVEVNDSTIVLDGSGVFNRQLVARGVKTVKARFTSETEHLYGFSIESERGVIIDNFAFRGISGMELQRLSDAMLGSINEQQPYDLIIIQFGPNLLFKPELVDFRWYEKPLKNVIRKFRQQMPDASILIVGSADKGCRYDGEYRTQKGVLPLIEVQNKAALESGVDFWSLYNAMGGRNSMVKWVNNHPPLANLDYTHLTHKGASKIAEIFFNQLMYVYDPEAASRSQIQPIARYVAVSRGL